MNNSYSILGYYICEFTNCPPFLNGIAEKIISISDCLCVHEPRIFLCHGWKPNGDNKDYIRLFSSHADYLQMSEEILHLSGRNLFAADGRFIRKNDAVLFYKKYFNKPTKYILVSVGTKEQYIKAFDDSFQIEKAIASNNENDIIGCDIIGWDISGFHSFLCNSLNEEFSDIEFNSYGLLNLPYTEVEQMALKIKGMGEPVEWIPVILHQIKI